MRTDQNNTKCICSMDFSPIWLNIEQTEIDLCIFVFVNRFRYDLITIDDKQHYIVKVYELFMKHSVFCIHFVWLAFIGINNNYIFPFSCIFTNELMLIFISFRNRHFISMRFQCWFWPFAIASDFEFVNCTLYKCFFRIVNNSKLFLNSIFASIFEAPSHRTMWNWILWLLIYFIL